MPCLPYRLTEFSPRFLMLVAFIACLMIGGPSFANAEPIPTQTPAATATPTPEPTPDPAAAKVEAVKTANREADRAMSLAEELQLAASRKSATVDERCKLATISDQTAIEFQQIAEETIDAAQTNLLTAITQADKNLKTTENKLKAARDALPTAEPLHADVTEAKADAESKLAEIANRIKSLNEEKTKLEPALQKGFTCAQGLVRSMSQKIAPLKALAADAKGDALLPVLNRSASDLAQVISLKWRVSTVWGADQSSGGLRRALSDLGKTEAELKTVTDGLATIDADIKAIGEKLKTWLGSLSAYDKARRAKLAELSQQVVVNPAMFSEPGLREVKAGTRLSADLTNLNAVLGLLEPQLRDVLSATDLQILSDAAADLIEETRKLGVAVTLLQDALGGSFENFEADQVSLFYFTDVARLIYSLNPAMFEVGGEADARERASQARRDLVEAELTLAEAQGRVNDQQRRLEELREEQRQAHAQFLSSDGLLTTSGRRLDELKARPDKDDRKITAAEQRHADLQAERDAAKGRDEELSNEQSGLPAKIREARNDLVKAQERVRTSRGNVVRLSLVESEAFARARDKTPFLVAMPLASSTDPAKRVLMYAFADSKTIFLRGNPSDLDKVRDIIDRFDRPTPQARMTLWSLELNSTADKDGSRRFNEALQTIEAELANTRARIATSLSFLRDCINEEVNRVALLKLEELRRERVANGVLSPTPQDQADLLWARLHFYQPEVLFRLGFDKTLEPRQSFSVARYTLPDPAATTTLGEALMILNLAKVESRWEIAHKFKDKLKERLDALGLADTLTDKQKKKNSDPHNLREPSQRFAFLRRAMGLDLDPVAPYVMSTSPLVVLDKHFAFNSTQQEIVRAIEADAVGKVLDRFRSLRAELIQLQQEIDNAKTQEEMNRVEDRRRNLVSQILPLIAWLKNEIGMNIRGNFRSPGVTVGINSQRTQTSSAVKQNAAAVEALATVVRNLNPSRRATARVAAADQMLKELIIAFEDDLDRHFVQPMMIRLRDGLVQQYKGIGVGIIQRTSVLASNRTLARVDARGSAQLALGEETDILEGVQQLANLYLAGQTGNALSILGGLKALPRRNSAELYGLTTGGVFKVTPIFDPSGQALRFQFDHVSATMVREPDGTVNPQLPRVERHTVNTEVQLSNMELREVSRFNANARLGLPKRTWGGLPIFNSIPWIRRNVPLIGWFVKKQGDAPFVQQSLIFGQTTMYPTIGDLMDLLRNADAPTEEEPKKEAEPNP